MITNKILPGQLYQYRNGGLNLFKEMYDKDILFIIQIHKKYADAYNPRTGEVFKLSNAWLEGVLGERVHLISE